MADGVYKEIIKYQNIISSANFKPTPEGSEIQALFAKNGYKIDFTFHIIHLTVAYCQQQEKGIYERLRICILLCIRCKKEMFYIFF